MDSYEKRGYLDREFRLFHLSACLPGDISYHYHDFDKVLIFLRGDVDYVIEGRSYHLNPYDIVLVGHHSIHKPLLRSGDVYERIVVYLSPGYVDSFRTERISPESMESITKAGEIEIGRASCRERV